MTTKTRAQLAREEGIQLDPDSGTPYVLPDEQVAEDKEYAAREASDGAELVAEGSTDVAQAQFLARQFRHEVLYNHSTRRWHTFDPKSGVWLPDRDRATEHKAVKYATRRVTDIGLAQMGERRRVAELKVARGLLKKDGIERALALLSWEPGYKTVGDDWDTDPYLLGTPRGVVDLRTGRNLPPDPTRRVSMTTGVSQDDSLTFAEAMAEAPRFYRFLLEVTSGDVELAAFYIRWFGYSLFGHTLATKFLILSGKLGFNGKGAMKRLMLHVMADYALELDQGFYERKRWTAGSDAPRADLMKLKGVRSAFLSEPTGAFNTELLKNHTGGDRITARALNSNDVQSWQVSHTITVLTNDIPPVSDVGLAVADRVMVADFREHFTGSDPNQPGYKDERLDEVLTNEAPAVLRMLVLAAVEWHEALQAGRKGLEPIPSRIVTASRDYMASNDAIGPFLDQWCSLEDDAQVSPKRLYDAYVEWHEDASRSGDDPGVKLGAADFGSAVGRKFEKKGKPPTYRGLRPLSAVELADRQPTTAEESA